MKNLFPKGNPSTTAKIAMNAFTDLVGPVVSGAEIKGEEKITVLMMLSIALAEELGSTELQLKQHFDWVLELARVSGKIRLRSSASNGKIKN